ncbi:AAA+ ATPase domain-containing protein [Plasmodiophora brassicae]
MMMIRGLHRRWGRRLLQVDARIAAPQPSPSAIDMTPEQIVGELDRHIIGQKQAKRAVAIALRERWRRQQLQPSMQKEVYPSNILMIGPTGSGKTETARRLAQLVCAPFVKVEATRYTEVGVYGTDTDTMVNDLVEASIRLHRQRREREMAADIEAAVENTLVDALLDAEAGPDRDSVRSLLQSGQLEDEMVSVKVADQGEQSGSPLEGLLKSVASMAKSGRAPPGRRPGVTMMVDMTERLVNSRMKAPAEPKKMPVREAREALRRTEQQRLLPDDELVKRAIADAEENGIIFLDEIDKIVDTRDNLEGSRRSLKGEGVQKELLPIIEGTVVKTDHGPVRTDHILFVASGAFSKSKPSDLLPELQGRLPIRVQLEPLTADDFKRILTETEFNLIEQHRAMLATENITLGFTEDGVSEIASVCFTINQSVENIGARRLRTVLAKVLEQISFSAASTPDNTTVIVDANYVRDAMKDVKKANDLSKFIL